MSLGTLIASSPLLFAHSFGLGSNHREASLDSRHKILAAACSYASKAVLTDVSVTPCTSSALNCFFFPMDLTMTTHGLHSRITSGAILMKRAEPVNCRRRVHLTLAAGELLGYVINILLVFGVDLFFTDAGTVITLATSKSEATLLHTQYVLFQGDRVVSSLWVSHRRCRDDNTPSSATTTIMPDVQVWCLFIGRNYKGGLKPTFGEPFPEILYHDDTIHQLKTKITLGAFKLSANNSFAGTKMTLSDLSFNDEYSDFQNIGVAQRVMDLELEDGELLLALVPQKGITKGIAPLTSLFSEFHIGHWTALAFTMLACLQGTRHLCGMGNTSP
ncbi:hypothetical protein H4582DRAFT_2057605 [Lactarius indigo]|nr:hypothetical protein H4582DRAFT_2057605 [Lactarius indigo]